MAAMPRASLGKATTRAKAAAKAKQPRASAAKPLARKTPQRAQLRDPADGLSGRRHIHGAGAIAPPGERQPRRPAGGQTLPPDWSATVTQLHDAAAQAADAHGITIGEVLTAIAAASDDPGEVVLPPAGTRAAEKITRELGPYLSGRALARRARITRQGVARRREKWAVIGVPTDSTADPILYPLRQFADLDKATVLPGVREAAATLAKGIDDPITIALWFDTPNPDLGGSTAYLWLRDGRDAGRVLAAAERDARRWRQ